MAMLRYIIAVMGVFLVFQSGMPKTSLATSDESFQRIDNHVLRASRSIERSPERLAAYFSQVAETDAEKARAIYRWITDRIRYDTDAFFSGNLSAVVSSDVLRSRKAVCSGYVVLFRDIAEYMGLQTEIITGHSKGYGFDARAITALADNHAWIAAKIEGEWQLIDPTWGAGFIPSDSREFVRNFTEHYFLANPEVLMYTHFPNEERWQLLENPLSEAEYLNLPMIHPLFFEWGLDFKQWNEREISADGVVEGQLGVPDSISVNVVVRNVATGNRSVVFRGYQEHTLDVKTYLEREGAHEMEIFARPARLAGDPLTLVATYSIANRQGKKQENPFPNLLGYYDMARAYLYSPLKSVLSQNEIEFKIRIPEALEVFIVDDTNWVEMKADGDVFTVSHTPQTSNPVIVAKFEGMENYSVLVEFGRN